MKRFKEILPEMLHHQAVLNDVATKGYPWWENGGLSFGRQALREAVECLDHMDDCWWKVGGIDQTQVQLEVIDVLHFLLGEFMCAMAHAGYPRMDSGWVYAIGGNYTFERAPDADIADLPTCSRDVLNTWHKIDGYIADLGMRYVGDVSAWELLERANTLYTADTAGRHRRMTARRSDQSNPIYLAHSHLVSELAAYCDRLPVLLNGGIPSGVQRLVDLNDVFDAFWAFTVACELNADLVYSIYFGKMALNAFRQENGYAEGNYDKLWFGGKEDNKALQALMFNYPKASIIQSVQPTDTQGFIDLFLRQLGAVKEAASANSPFIHDLLNWIAYPNPGAEGGMFVWGKHVVNVKENDNE